MLPESNYSNVIRNDKYRLIMIIRATADTKSTTDASHILLIPMYISAPILKIKTNDIYNSQKLPITKRT